MNLISIYESSISTSILKNIKQFCDDWNNDQLFGNRQSYKLARKYLDIYNPTVNESDYIHGTLVGIIEWCTMHDVENEPGSMYNRHHKKFKNK